MKHRGAKQAPTSVVDWTHPETRPGEIFLHNSSGTSFHTLDFASKRQGLVAYDGEGRRLGFPDWHPVFLEQEELTSRRLNLQELRKILRDQEVPLA